MELYEVRWAVARMRAIAEGLQRAPEIARSLAADDARKGYRDTHRTRVVALETSIRDAAEALLCEAAALEQSMKRASTDAPVEAQ